jgi:hypothetical protein
VRYRLKNGDTYFIQVPTTITHNATDATVSVQQKFAFYDGTEQSSFTITPGQIPSDGWIAQTHVYTNTDGVDTDLVYHIFDNDGTPTILNLIWGDPTVLHYEGLPTEELALVAGDTYYFSVWLYNEQAARDVNVTILSEDGSELVNTTPAIGVGFVKLDVSFVPAVSKAGAHAMIVRPDGNAPLYVYGIAVTEGQTYSTFTEVQAIQKTLPVLYI